MKYRHRCLALVAIAFVLSACGKPTKEVYNWKGPVTPGAWMRLRNSNGEFTVTAGTGDSATIRFEIQRETPFSPPAKIKILSVADGVLGCVVYGENNTCTSSEYQAGSSYKQSRLPFFGGNTSVVGIVTLPRGVKLDIESTNGDVTVDGQSAELLLQTVNGDITASGIRGTSRVNTTNGDITLAVDSANGALTFGTTNGDITLQLPDALNAALALRTTNGELNMSYPGTIANSSKRQIIATLGSGGSQIDISTTNGDVTVKKVGTP
jgi:hypothetical protein